LAITLELLRASDDPQWRRILKVFADRGDEAISPKDLAELAGLEISELKGAVEALEERSILVRRKGTDALRLNREIEVEVLRIIVDSAAAGTFGIDERKGRQRPSIGGD
jgi:transcription initiation factor IIE alpha subunit